MAATGDGFLFDAAAYLGAAAIAVPVFRKLKLGSIIGYLAAGVALGPSGFRILNAGEGVFHVAELGVVLFLFIIGLELSLARLWSLRREIFGLGAAQVLLTGVALAGVLAYAGVAPPAAMLAGFALAYSSTAFALQLLEERGETNSAHGRTTFSVLLFQDLAVIPLLAAIPILAAEGAAGSSVAEGVDPMAVLKAVSVIAALIVIGKYLLNPIFRLVARSGSREAFAALALFVVAATALSVSWAGLSMALGAFLAGVLLADSSYRHQIETDIEPFRGLLLGLFFIGVGMQLDLGVVAAQWMIVIGGALALIAIKATLFYSVARVFRIERGVALRAAAALSQGGEFAYVVFSLGAGAGIFGVELATVLSAIVTVSMALTPPLLSFVANATAARKDAAPAGDAPDGIVGDAIIVGYGRMGQVVSQILRNSGIAVTAIDSDPERIRTAERFGYKVYFGDGTRLDLLMHAGAVKADLVILLVDDTEKLSRSVERLREQFPKLRIITRAHDRIAELELMDLEIDHVVRDVLESAILVARKSLETLDVDDTAIDSIIAEFRKADRERLFLQKAGGMEAGKEILNRPYTVTSTPRRKEKVET